MNAKHTQTPWKTDLEYDEAADGIPIYCDYEHEGRRYTAHAAVVPGFKRSASDEQKANADFICRAVNAHERLVEALRRTLKALEAHLDESCRDHNLKHRDQLCACNTHEVLDARAALAAAETQTERGKP